MENRASPRMCHLLYLSVQSRLVFWSTELRGPTKLIPLTQLWLSDSFPSSFVFDLLVVGQKVPRLQSSREVCGSCLRLQLGFHLERCEGRGSRVLRSFCGSFAVFWDGSEHVLCLDVQCPPCGQILPETSPSMLTGCYWMTTPESCYSNHRGGSLS